MILATKSDIYKIVRSKVMQLHTTIKALQLSAVSQISLPDLSDGKKILIKGLAGALGAGIGAVILFPLENVKIRQMVEDRPHNEKQRGLIAQIQHILKHEGVTGLYIGCVPYVAYSVASWGIFFLIYEFLK
jgi:hypothetical protein